MQMILTGYQKETIQLLASSIISQIHKRWKSLFRVTKIEFYQYPDNHLPFCKSCITILNTSVLEITASSILPRANRLDSYTFTCLVEGILSSKTLTLSSENITDLNSEISASSLPDFTITTEVFDIDSNSQETVIIVDSTVIETLDAGNITLTCGISIDSDLVVTHELTVLVPSEFWF